MRQSSHNERHDKTEYRIVNQSIKIPVASQPRPSASIILLREGEQDVELFVVRRNQQMRFAPGATAFPGGALDRQDIEFAKKLDADDPLLPYRINAIRELFEETGLLLASDRTGNFLSAAETAVLSHYRKALVDDLLSFEQFVSQEQLVLEIDSLVHFARWVAPAVVKPRFETDFFLALEPGDQQGQYDPGELDAAYWSPLGMLMQQLQQGEINMVFPTEMNCLRLMQHSTVEQLMSELAQPAPVIRTVAEETPEGIFLCTPPEAGVGEQRRKFQGARVSGQKSDTDKTT